MPVQLSIPILMSDLAADAATVSFDLRGGGYDRLHRFIESSNILPKSLHGRLAVIAVMLLTSRVAKQQLGTPGVVANFLKEIADDGVREEAKRILDAVLNEPQLLSADAKYAPVVPGLPAATVSTTKAPVIVRVANGITGFMFPWMPRR